MPEPPLPALENLPHELLTLIRAYLWYDFRDHVYFASTSPKIYSLYSDGDWKSILRRCQFGRGRAVENWPENHSLCNATWGAVAFALQRCLKVDGVPWLEEIRDLLSFTLDEDVKHDAPVLAPQIVEEQKIECTSFATSLAIDWLGKHPFTFAVFWGFWGRAPDIEDFYNYRAHTAATFQHVTWPPLQELTIDLLSQADIYITNPDGVTVWDCILGIYHRLVGTPLAITDLIDIYANWSFVERLNFLSWVDEDVEVHEVIDFLRETVKNHPSSVDEVDRVISLVPESLHSNPILQAFSIPGESDKLVEQFPTVSDLTSWIRQYLPSSIYDPHFAALGSITTWGEMLQDVIFGINQISPGSSRFELEIEGGGFDTR